MNFQQFYDNSSFCNFDYDRGYLNFKNTIIKTIDLELEIFGFYNDLSFDTFPNIGALKNNLEKFGMIKIKNIREMIFWINENDKKEIRKFLKVDDWKLYLVLIPPSGRFQTIGHYDEYIVAPNGSFKQTNKRIRLYSTEEIGIYCRNTYLEMQKFKGFNSWREYENSLNSPQSVELAVEDKIEITKPSTEIDTLIGLKNVKAELKSLFDTVKIRELRKKQGLLNTPSTLHMVFTGNPGTGKTTVARYIGKIYHEMGLLEKGHLIEVDRSGLVAEYVGHTAIKTTKKFNEAIGGVLFIDEAYALLSGNNNDFGREAIDTLLKLMEDNRDKVVVIIAGYTEKIEQFISSNPGLTSRFPTKIHFEDYNFEELLDLIKQMAKKQDYRFNNDCEMELKELLENKSKNEDFGNGRGVRNLLEKIIRNQASRITKMNNPTMEDLMTLTKDDFIE